MKLNTTNPLKPIMIRIITNTTGIDRKPLICVDSDDISYSRIVSMYTAGDGVGLQYEANIDEDAALIMCDKIAMAVRDYYLSHLPCDETINAPMKFFDGKDNSIIEE
jgi:hypothetical protein